jgi:hypothetical protein
MWRPYSYERGVYTKRYGGHAMDRPLFSHVTRGFTLDAYPNQLHVQVVIGPVRRFVVYRLAEIAGVRHDATQLRLDLTNGTTDTYEVGPAAPDVFEVIARLL